MSCYRPLKAIVYSDPVYQYGKKKVKILGKFDYDQDSKSLKDGSLSLVPCGKCIGCKLDYARNWANRLALEMEVRKKALFLTLTYEDNYLPYETDINGEVLQRRYNEAGAPVAPLVKDHMSWFMKNLRERLTENKNKSDEDIFWKFLIDKPDSFTYNEEKNKHYVELKFFGCGEYGEKRGRPHLHIILYGLDLDDLKVLGNVIDHDINELGQKTYRSEFLESVWKQGIVGVSEANFDTMSYTARYTTKKAFGNKYPEEYRLPAEFTNMSRRPGIGASFIKDHEENIDTVSQWYINGKDIYWPSYILRKMYCEQEDIERFSEFGASHTKREVERPNPKYNKQYSDIKKQNQEMVVNKMINHFEYDERTYSDKQLLLERQKENQIKKVRRGEALKGY